MALLDLCQAAVLALQLLLFPSDMAVATYMDGKIPSSLSPARDSECISVPGSHKDQKGVLDFLELGS